MDTDPHDLLSFKEFPLIEENFTNSNTAQLSINSPKKSSPIIDDENEGESELVLFDPKDMTRIQFCFLFHRSRNEQKGIVPIN